MTEPVVLQKKGAIAHIVLNNPERGNAMNVESITALGRCIHEVAADASLRVVVLRANGRIFCAGGDIDSFKQASGELPELMAQLLGPLNAAMHTLATLPIPVISAVNGPVGGGGIGLALCADIVIAAESMKLRGGYTAIGLTPDAGASWFLTRLAGPMRAKQIFLCNQPVSARQCLDWGIVSEVVPDDQLLPSVEKLAQVLSGSAIGALGRTKHLIDEACGRPLPEQLELERRYMIESSASHEATEGLAAFLEKRAPRFDQLPLRTTADE